VDEVLEDVYAHLTEGGDSFRVAALPEPDGIPPEEKTEEFMDALAHAKVSDMDYLAALDQQAASALKTTSWWDGLSGIYGIVSANIAGWTEAGN